MNKFTLLISLILLLNGFVSAQMKSIPDAENEIRGFENFASFSVTYDDPKDATTARLTIDIREGDKSLEKPFKKFDWELIAVFAGKGIDDKPVRHQLCINTQSKGFRFASGNALSILLGNENIEFDIPDRSTEAKGRKVKENLCWEINRELIRDFAEAESLNFQVGSVKSFIPAGKLRIFKDYAKLLEFKVTGDR